MRAHELGVTFGGSIRALAGVEFAIPRGQFVSIVGPSGCGKSTLLRLIAGVLGPTAGELTVGGESPTAGRRHAARVSFVFQDATLLPWRTAQANVELPLELARTPRRGRAQTARRALATVGLADFSGRYPSQLSGGMRMRVSLARALVIDPELLLLDEPFGALDDITRQALGEELLSLWDLRRWTGVFVTHNIAEAVFLSQRILVMSPRPGRIVADVGVPFAAPRRVELRAEADFATLCGEVAARLREGGR